MKSTASIAALFGLLLLLLSCSTRIPAPAPSASPPDAPPLPRPSSGATSPPPSGSSLRVGWAYEAYPEVSYAQMVSEMRSMRQGGADSIWIGHNNPGDVDSAKVEPGLSFAVWYAIYFESGSRQSQARAMSDAVRRALDAARFVGLKVVLPIGYQMMMGSTWNAEHPDSLRRAYDGSLLRIYGSAPTASPYDPAYRADISSYYDWVEREWVKPYRDTIDVLSLSDEPLGGDYSPAAHAEFQRRYGIPIESLAQGEEWKLGEFEAGVVVDFASWSGEQWHALDPDISTTISFHSQDARTRPGLPDVERLFSETPRNFVVTFDTYLHDDLPNKPASAGQTGELRLFLTTLGHYSRVYKKPLFLWAGVNAWGLAEESSAPLGAGDAAANLLMLGDLPSRTGGDVQGLYAWNYNVKEQGLENYSRATRYTAQGMKAAVEGAFAILRTGVRPAPRAPDAAVLLSPRELYTSIGQDHSSEAPPPWFNASELASGLENRAAALVTPGPSLEAAREAERWICLAHGDALDDSTIGVMQAAVEHGALVMAHDDVARRIQAPRQVWPEGLKEVPVRGGVVYVIPEQSGLK